MTLLPEYTHIINNKLKHTYLSFDNEGNLIIKSPKVSQAFIEQLLLKKSNWINSSREKILNKKGRKVTFKKETTLFYLGQAYTLHCIQYTKKKYKLIFENKIFTLYYPTYNEESFQKSIDHFYKKESEILISPLVKEWSNEMQIYPNKVSFRKAKRQWGSCSGNNHLSFNTMMIKLPLDVIQYIIIHELAHIKHKHHQKSFWFCVEQYLPDYKQQIKVLKTYTTY